MVSYSLHNYYCLSINGHKGGNKTDLLLQNRRQESSAPGHSGVSPSEGPQTRESSQNEASPDPCYYYHSSHSCRHPFLTLNCHCILDTTIIFVTLLHNNTRDLLINCMMFYYYHDWYTTRKHRGRRRTFTTKLTFRIIKSDGSPPVESRSYCEKILWIVYQILKAFLRLYFFAPSNIAMLCDNKL